MSLHTVSDPGSAAQFNWRTTSYDNGTYTLQPIGLIGDLFEIPGELITVTVAN